MASSRRDVSFLHSLAATPLGQLIWPEGAIAAVVGIGGGTALHHYDSLTARVGVVGDSLVIGATLLGIVFAAFALLISLWSEEYVRLLDVAEGGVIAFLRPFILAIGWQVITLLLALTYRAIAERAPGEAEFAIFLSWAFLFVYVLADIVALARNLMMHGLTRAQQIRVSRGDAVRSIRERRN